MGWLPLALLASVCHAETASTNWLTYLRPAVQSHPAVLKFLPTLPPASPELALLTFRATNSPSIHFYHSAAGNACGQPYLPAILRDRLGDANADAAGSLVRLIQRPPVSFGPPAELQRHQRAIEHAFLGNLSLLREQTVDPLRVLGVLICTDRHLPTSLRGRVQAVVLDAQLSFNEWRGQLHFIARTPAEAEPVANIIAAWRDLAGALASHYADHRAAERLRLALQASSVTLDGERVTCTLAVPALAVAQLARVTASLETGCPPGGGCDPDKIPLCHRHSTICVPASEVSIHLAHGDTCGACP